MRDVFLRYPWLLGGKPKTSISEYVQKNGILIPRKFDSLEEAKKSGLEVICRSEHLQDYQGFSGILDSPDIENFEFGKFKNIEEKNINDYCKIMGIDRERFLVGLSYSYWEKLDGYNRSIIADSSIRGRYHIFTTQDFYHNYTIWDNGKIDLNDQLKLHDDLMKNISDVIEFYEEIRNLSNFDPNHCPLIEFQTVGDKNYFLQYLRVRDFNECDFELDREGRPDEIEVDFVRGHSSSIEGDIYDFQRLHIGFDNVRDHNAGLTINNPMLSEYSALRYDLLMSGYKRHRVAFHTVDHLGKSQIFKPKIFVSESRDLLFSDDEIKNGLRKNSNKPSLVAPIRIVSDARKAYVSRV